MAGIAEYFETGLFERVNAASLSSVAEGSIVAVVGTLKDGMVIEASDGGSIRIIETDTITMPSSGIVEILGSVENSSAVKPIRVTSFGDNFDLKNYEGLLTVMKDPAVSHLYAPPKAMA
mmetsp:Transcript_16014/g.24029  ORF Transcript_16014/g.24029 Transcript_16014/m.24029 type:complete len:119 (+) Transcript_16014:59-415(+)